MEIVLPMLKLHTNFGFHKLFLNSNITPFIDYINNAMIKFPTYLNSHMRIALPDKLRTSLICDLMYLYRTIGQH
jgi:hypothetical protein